MNLSYAEALALAEAYGRESGAVWFEGREVCERGRFWFFPIGYIGSIGVFVDKDGGRITVVGSGESVDDVLWAYDHGFLPVPLTLRVTRVIDLDKAIEFLLDGVEGGLPRSRNPNPRRAWLREALGALPCEFANERLWGRSSSFRRAEPWRWFEYTLEPSEPTGPRVGPSEEVWRTPEGRPVQSRDLELRRPSTCPQCGAGDLQRIVFGLPSSEALEMAKRGEVRLGGCMVAEVAPDWYCRHCACEWFDETDPARQLLDGWRRRRLEKKKR